MSINDFWSDLEKRQPIYEKIDMGERGIKEGGLNSLDSYYPQKIYQKYYKEINFTKKENCGVTWNNGAFKAVSDFIANNDIFEHRARIIEISYPFRDERGIVVIECYMRVSK